MRHSLAYNVAFRVDEQRVRYGVNVVYLGGFAFPAFQVGHLWPRQVQCLDGILPCLLVIVERYAHYLQAVCLVLIVELDEFGH